MNTVVLSLALLPSITFAADKTSWGQSPAPAKAPPPTRVGQVYIIDNEFTRQEVILRVVDLQPGQILYYADLIRTQRKVDALGVFKPGGVEVTAEGDPNNPGSEYKNVFIRVEETPTWSVRLAPTVNWQGMPVFSLVWEERNFDPGRFPFSLEDLLHGGAFRGGGLWLRLEFQLPIVP